MKSWSENHPKSRLIARKRTAILEAARSMFLEVGYNGASMEAIAGAAGVSIMTLYRHARSKDELFAAVMLNACNHAYNADAAKIISLTQPLESLLLEVAEHFQEKLMHPDTVSLFRTVMVETERFPNLGNAAYRGFIESWAALLDECLAGRSECLALSDADRRASVADFIDDLIGADFVRALLGISMGSVEGRMRRSRAAAERLLQNLGLRGANPELSAAAPKSATVQPPARPRRPSRKQHAL